MRLRLALVGLVAAAAAQASPREAAMAPLAAQGWRVRWDRTTGAAAGLWGGHVDAPGAVRDPDVAERAARAFVAAHAEVFGLAPGDLVLASNVEAGGVRTVGFRQTWRGVPVIGGQLGFVFAHDRLFAVLGHALPDVQVAWPAPRLPDATLAARAETWLSRATGRAVATRAIGARAILALAPGDYRVVDVLDVAARGAPGRWDVYVGADGTPLGRASRILDATGTLEYDAGVRYATGPRASYPAPDAAITVDGAAATTGDDGSFAWSGTAAATVVPGLSGSYVQILDAANPLATASLTAQPGQPVTWSLATDEVGDAQVSAYVYASLAKARDRTVDPAAAAWLDTPLPVHVNEPGECNAYATADEVHFFRAGPECQNTARVADIVFHEIGHTLHAHTVIAGAGAFEPQLSEGLADFGAANLTEDPGIGRGLYYDDTPARNIDPYGHEPRWPDDIDVDNHVTGEIESGALWDLRTALVRQLGHDAGVAQTEKIFTGIMQRAPDIPGSYLAALIADDDDGDLGDGTPHYCTIRQAFGVHGLAEPDFATTAIAASVTGETVSVAVTTPAGAPCPPPQVTSITVSWHVGSAVANQLPLTAQGATWTGSFPAQPPGTVILYSIDAALDDGTHLVLPDNPADPEYQLFVGDAAPIACATMDTDPGWSQAGNHGDEWQWLAPPAGSGGRDPHQAHTGAAILGTAIQRGAYLPDDVTSITTPPIDVSAYQLVHLQYWRWLTVEDASYDQAEVDVNGTPVWHNARSRPGTLDHVDKEWRFQDFDVSPLVTGGTIQTTWALRSDSSNQFGGWMLDDVCLVGLTKNARCGDGVVDPGEQCDDGNTTGGDGCSASCQDELTAGGGGCSATRGPGWALLALGYLLWRCCCRSRSSRWPSRSVSARMP